MPDITLTLGGIAFRDFEVPEEIGFGGEQMLSIKRLVGGLRAMDAMGADEAPLEWAGRFRGPDALARARAIDALRKAGQPLSCTWGEMAFTVVIRSFRPVYRFVSEIPYSIVCEVQSDDASATSSGPSLDEMIGSDMASADILGGGIGDSVLSGLLGGLDTAIGMVSDFATASSAVLTSVLTPIAAVQDRVQLLLASAENTILNVTTVGGVLPASPVSRMAGGLLSQVSALTSASDLYELDAIMGRMATNIGAVGASGSVTIVAGGDLYRMAQQAYGDAAEWPTIARANGLTDPVLEGIQAILVPPLPGGSGGVLDELLQTNVQATLRLLTEQASGVTADAGLAFDFTNPANLILA